MPYLYRARQFAVDHLATNLDSKWLRDQRGVLGKDHQLDLEKAEKDSADNAASESSRIRLARKMHSLYFPSVWNEALVSPANIMLLAGKSRNADEANFITKALSPIESDIPEEERVNMRENVQKEAVKTLFTR